MIRIGIVGITGYGGRELLRLLAAHPEAEVTRATSTTQAGKPLGEVLPAFGKTTEVTLEAFDAKTLADTCDLVFLAAPGTESMVPGAALRAEGMRVIDIGPDFRLNAPGVFHQYYGAAHTAPELLDEAVYGLVPHNRESLADAQLVAVPGCYPIGALLPLKPILAHTKLSVPPVIDSISGISGAGRSLSEAFHFAEMNENVFAYKLGTHQHIPEIEQELGGVTVQFSPHVGPYTRGILSTITVRLENDLDVTACYEQYAAEPFVRVLEKDTLPQLKQVRGSNFCDIGWVSDPRTGNLILVSAIDNLVGGTAGMAIQCMNLMFGLDETIGLGMGGMSI